MNFWGCDSLYFELSSAALYSSLSCRVGPQQEEGRLREEQSNNDQSLDLYTLTLSFHTQPITATGCWGLEQGGEGMPSPKIDLHYSQIFHK